MARKIFKSGNSAVVSLPQTALDRLGISVGSTVDLRVDGERGEIVLSPARDSETEIDRDFAEKVDEFKRRYGPALRALADS